jgi:hypothetical protein
VHGCPPGPGELYHLHFFYHSALAMLKKLLWFMPTWLQGLIYYSISGILFIGSGVAATLYLFQVILPSTTTRPAGLFGGGDDLDDPLLACLGLQLDPFSLSLLPNPTPPQNRMLYHPEIPRIPRDPAGNPARYRHPGESYYDMPYDDEEVAFPSFPPSTLPLPLHLPPCRLLACLASFPARVLTRRDGGWVPLSASDAEQLHAEDLFCRLWCADTKRWRVGTSFCLCC